LLPDASRRQQRPADTIRGPLCKNLIEAVDENSFNYFIHDFNGWMY
jgi:hypothetical protein